MRPILLALVLAVTIIGSGCSDDTPSTPSPTPVDSFNFGVRTGVKWTYLDQGDSTNTEAGFFTIGNIDETIVGTETVAGRTAFLHENRLFPVADPTNPEIDTARWSYDANSAWWYLSSPEDILGDGLPLELGAGFNPGWYQFYRPNSAVNVEYAIMPLDTVQAAISIPDVPQPIPATLIYRGVGKVLSKNVDSVTVNGTRYATTKLEVRILPSIVIPGFTVPPLAPFVTYTWVVNGIGVVRSETEVYTISIPPLTLPSLPRFRQTLTSFTRP